MTTESKAVEKREARAETAPTREWGRVYVPPVDIYENEEHLVMRIDMPGVGDKSAEVVVENRVLTIEAQVDLDVPAGYDLTRAESQARGYRRVFELSDEIDDTAIKASMKNGLLKIVIPKKEGMAKDRKTIAIASE